MPPNDDHFLQNAPEATDFIPLVSEISKLLGSDLENRIRNELKPRQTPATVDPANQGRVISAYDALVAAVDNLEKAKKDLDALRAYVEAAEEYTAQQLQFHASFKAYVERTTDQLALRSELASPLRRLPNEVLQLIFVEVHAQATERERYNPITARVCTFWRQLAHATPFLWTSIDVNLKGDGEDIMAAVAEMETRMKRGKERLVAVRFTMHESPTAVEILGLERLQYMIGNKEPQGDDHPFTIAITALLKYKDKLASLRIPRHKEALGGQLATKCATENITFKNLHTLSLYEGTWTPHDFDVRPLLKACPKIERLRIYAAPNTPYIHWEKMKEFSGHLDTEVLSTFLSRAQDVKQARISTPLWATLPTITFGNHLTALSLGHLRRGCAGRLATAARPSALRYLSLEGSREAAATLLGSWGRDLEFLALDFEIAVKHLKNLLTTTPNLQGLRFHGRLGATPPNLFTGALPKLTHLEILCGSRRLDEFEDWVRLLLARSLKPTSRGKRPLLRSVAFLPDSDSRERSRRRFCGERWESLYRDLKEVGIEVHEYRAIDILDITGFDYTSVGSLVRNPGFDTAFFQERGWCV